MQVTAIQVSNFKRVHEVEIRPEADRVVILIGGNNGNGKSSVLDALTAAFGGKSALPADPVRHGAEKAEIRVELDGGALTIRRSIDPDGSSKLEVRDELGAVRKPQDVLDKLVSGRFLDPLAFLALKPAEQRAELLRLVDKEGAIAKLDDRRGRVFDRRTEVARDHRKASGELERMTPADPAQVIDVAELSAESRKLGETLLEAKNLRSKLEYAERSKIAAQKKTKEAADALDRAVAAHKEAAAAESDAIDVFVAAGAACEKAPVDAYAVSAQQSAIELKIKDAASHNEGVAQVKAAEARRLQVKAEVEKLAAGVATLADEIVGIDAQKAQFLATAALPVPGLGVAVDGVTLEGVPLAQASDAERLRVALALAVASNPELRDVWIKDGALLDDRSLELVAELAAATGCRCWIERVGTRDPGAIVIHDGRIAEKPAEVVGQGSLFT